MSVYVPRNAPDDSRAPCHPESKILACNICTRWRSAPALPPEKRQFVVIDASLFVVDGVCQMFEGRPTVRPYCEPAESESA